MHARVHGRFCVSGLTDTETSFTPSFHTRPLGLGTLPIHRGQTHAYMTAELEVLSEGNVQSSQAGPLSQDDLQSGS